MSKADSITSSSLWHVRFKKAKTGVIGEFKKREDLETEYKAFHLSDTVTMALVENEIFQKVLASDYWDVLGSLFELRLKEYINKYVPWYMVSFSNTDIKTGCLYFGISDLGEVIGFPLTKKLLHRNYRLIRLWIKRAVFRTLKQNDQQNKTKNFILCKRVFKSVKVSLDILKLDSKTFDCQIDHHVKMYEEQVIEYDKTELDFANNKQMWLDKLRKYKQAVNNMVNDRKIRDEVIDFINLRCDLGEDVKSSMINKLKESGEMNFEKTQITSDKYDPTKLIHWIVQFREIMTNTVFLEKPKSNNLLRPMSPYFTLLRDYKPLVKRMVENGTKIGLLKITLPGRLKFEKIPHLGIQCGDSVKYLWRELDSSGSPITVF